MEWLLLWNWLALLIMKEIFSYFFPLSHQSTTIYHRETQVKARRYGYEGAMYPWEAAFTGADVCPGESYIKSEVHVTADVAFALRQYLYATNDTTILTDRDTNGAYVIQVIGAETDSE